MSTEPVEKLLERARAEGLQLRWRDGKLEGRGGSPDLRQAISDRKKELAPCPRCGEVAAIGQAHCPVPPSWEVIAEGQRAAEDPFFAMNWTPPVQPCDMCRKDAPYRFPLPSWCESCSQLPQRRCEGCGHSQPGHPGTVEDCAYDGCGNRLRWVDSCVVCQRDAMPGSTRCLACSP